MDIDIELLQLNIDNVSGHEHRIGAIAARAAEILAQRLDAREDGGAGGSSVPVLNAAPVNLDLNRTSDEFAALSIASAWIEALTAKLEAGG